MNKYRIWFANGDSTVYEADNVGVSPDGPIIGVGRVTAHASATPTLWAVSAGKWIRYEKQPVP